MCAQIFLTDKGMQSKKFGDHWSPLPQYASPSRLVCPEGLSSTFTVQGANRTSHCKCTLNLAMNRKTSETGAQHEKEMTRERPLMIWFLCIHKLEAITCPVDKQNSKGWHESMFAKQLFSVLKVILWSPEHRCWQMMTSGIVNVLCRSVFQYKNIHFSTIQKATLRLKGQQIFCPINVDICILVVRCCVRQCFCIHIQSVILMKIKHVKPKKANICPLMI